MEPFEKQIFNAFPMVFVMYLIIARIRRAGAKRDSSRHRHRRSSSRWRPVLLFEMCFISTPPKMRDFLPVFGVKGMLGYGVNHDHTLTYNIKKATVRRHVRTAA